MKIGSRFKQNRDRKGAFRIAFSNTVLILVFAACVFAQSPVAPPVVGLIRDSARAVRPVIGLAGNFILGDAVKTGVISAAFSSSAGIVKTDSELLAIDTQNRVLATLDAPAGRALISFLSNSEAIIYLEQNQTLLRWNGSSFDSLPFDPTQFAGGIVSVAFAGSQAVNFLVQRADGLWLLQSDVSTGSIQSAQALPGLSAPALVMADGSLLYTDSGALVLRRADVSESRFSLSGDVASFEQMNDEWVHIHERDGPRRGAGRDFALHLTKGAEQLYELPHVAHESQ